MKNKIIALIGVAALLATVSAPLSAQAQGTRFGYAGLTLPPILAAGTTNLVSPVILNVGSQRHVTFSSTISGGANGATNIFYFARSVDGVNYDTNTADIFSATNIVPIGVQTNITVVDWDVLGATSLSMFSEKVVSATGNVTNITSGYGIKINAP